MKGIILAGGSGSRLYPITLTISKQLLPIYDKPMIYYPLSVLIQMGIREVLFITTPRDSKSFKDLLGDGSQLGCKFEYQIQPEPNGLSVAFIIGEKFIGNDNVTLVLGDNIFYGDDFQKNLQMINFRSGGMIFASHVQDPERYGVVEFDENDLAISIEEKPKVPKSNYAVPGLYIFDNNVIEVAKGLRPSSRGELEITDLNMEYLKEKRLKVHKMSKSTAWFDTGTVESYHEAGEFVRVIQKRQGINIGCIEETAYMNGYITKADLEKIAKKMEKSSYGKYLLDLL